MTKLIRTEDGNEFTAGDVVEVKGETVTITELEFPDPDFVGCVHFKRADGTESHCDADALDADWCGNDGQPYVWDTSASNREDFESGRWTRADSESMERGRDTPMMNEAGEYM